MALPVINFLTFLLTAFYAITVLFFWYGWKRIQVPKATAAANRTRVSIIIAARNEEDKIALTIEDIVKQKYPKDLIELIVIDDHSTDNTAEIISGYHNQGVTLIKLNEDKPLNSYKKKAIAEAIQIAQGELIITTDADCRMGASWLTTIVNHYEANNFKLISSPVAFFEENNLFEKLQTLEFLYLIGLGAATIGNKNPSTCNGANLAYRKDVFHELKGFQGIDDLASGDDELFLHKVAAKYPDDIGFCKDIEAMVYTHAKPTVKDFIMQRKRWASKSTRYKNKSIVFLGVAIWLFNLLILINIGLSFWSSDYWPTLLTTLTIKALTELIFLFPVTSFAKRRELLWYIPILSFIHTLYITYIGLAGNSGKYVWKGRLVK